MTKWLCDFQLSIRDQTTQQSKYYFYTLSIFYHQTENFFGNAWFINIIPAFERIQCLFFSYFKSSLMV